MPRVEKLRNDPRPMVFEKLTGERLYRIRHRKYMNIYSIQDKGPTVWVIWVGHRKDVYR